RAALGGLDQRKQRLCGHPSVLHGQIPTARLLALTDDNLDAVVLHIQRLSAALHAVAEDRDSLRAENRLQSLRRIIGAFHHGFGYISNLDLSHDRWLGR